MTTVPNTTIPMLDSPHMPPTPIAVLGASAVAAVGALAAGMAEWSPGDWAAFVTVLTGAIGTVTALTVKFLRDLKAEFRKGVQQAAAIDPLANTGLPRSVEELNQLLHQTATIAAQKAAVEAIERAARAKLDAEPPRVQT